MEYKPKILIVDDKKENLFALERVLQERDADIIKATSGNDALKSTLEHEFAVAILDVQMPEMDGYELAELLRSQKQTRHLPIIFMSAVYSGDYYVFKGYDAGAVDFIVKPYNPKVLISKVDVFLQLATNLHRLQESEERFKTLVMTIPDIVYRIDREGHFIFVNDAVKRLGYDPKQVIGKPFSHIIFPPDVEAVSRRVVLPKYTGKKTGDKDAPKLFDERRTGKRRTTGLEIRLAVKSTNEPKTGLLQPIGDELIIVEVNSSGMYEVNPNTANRIFIGTVGVIRDITERKRAEEAHREALVKERLKVLLQMAGATAHEMNQPLTALLGNIDLLAFCKDEPEKLAEKLDTIRDAGRRIADTISKIQNIRHYAIKPYTQDTSIIDIHQDVEILSGENSDQDAE
ncbi:MAG: response regulator [Deltaproteobacteria bacterium]|nr:response regulator [Deltaproteobacteria bacterium]